MFFQKRPMFFLKQRYVLSATAGEVENINNEDVADFWIK